LADGSTLYVRLGGGIPPELDLRWNGVPVPGSRSDGPGRTRRASFWVFNIAAFTALVVIRFLNDGSGRVWFPLAVTTFFLFLGILTWFESRAALGIAFALFCLETLNELIHPGRLSGRAALIWYGWRAVTFIGMARGFGGIHSKQNAQGNPAAPQPVPAYGGPAVAPSNSEPVPAIAPLAGSND
jgi:hypothetical protein